MVFDTLFQSASNLALSQNRHYQVFTVQVMRMKGRLPRLALIHCWNESLWCCWTLSNLHQMHEHALCDVANATIIRISYLTCRGCLSRARRLRLPPVAAN